MGKTPPRKEVVYWDNAIYPWVSIADMRDNDRIITTREKVNQYAFLHIFKGNISKAGTLLMSFKLTVGKVSILSIDAFHNEAIISIYPHYVEQDIQRDYLFKFLPLLTQFGKTKTAIKGNTLNSDSIDTLLIPLPPVQEQARIVACIESLEPFIEEYNLVESELSKLNETFPEQIKKSILQYAIQGKLLPQDPNDEPASVLLEKIKAEKQKLIKAGKIKKDKVESYIYKRDNRHYEKIGDKEVDITDEIPFEIPPSWAWVRFKNLVHYRMGKTPQRKNEQFWEHGTFPWVSIADLISDGMLERTKEKISDYAVSQIFKGEFSPRGTLLMSFKLTVGKVSVLNINAVHNEAIISIYPYLNTDNSMRDYLFKFMPLLSQEGRTKTAIKGKTLNSDSIDALLIPLPPVAEQKRIVTKMDKLLSLFPTHN